MKYVYKIIAALGAISVLPLLVFLKTIYFKMSSTALSAIFFLGQLLGKDSFSQIVQENNGVPNAIADNYSIYDLYKLFSGFGSAAGNADLSENFDALIAPAITAGIALVLIAICAIVTAIFALVMKDNRKVIYSSMVGLGLSLMFQKCFEGLATPILNGTISISTLIDSMWGGLIGNMEKFELTSNFWFIPAVFGAIILWTVLYNYTLPEKEKKERKLMLGEADDE